MCVKIQRMASKKNSRWERDRDTQMELRANERASNSEQHDCARIEKEDRRMRNNTQLLIIAVISSYHIVDDSRNYTLSYNSFQVVYALTLLLHGVHFVVVAVVRSKIMLSKYCLHWHGSRQRDPIFSLLFFIKSIAPTNSISTEIAIYKTWKLQFFW